MIKTGSRYARVETYDVLDPRRAEAPIEGLAPHLPEPLEVRRHHLVLGHERLDHLGHRYYRESRRYWLIADAHDDVIFPIDLMQAGRVLEPRRPRRRPRLRALAAGDGGRGLR